MHENLCVPPLLGKADRLAPIASHRVAHAPFEDIVREGGRGALADNAFHAAAIEHPPVREVWAVLLDKPFEQFLRRIGIRVSA